MNGGMHQVDAFNADVSVRSNMHELRDIELMLPTESARNKVRLCRVTAPDRIHDALVTFVPFIKFDLEPVFWSGLIDTAY